MNIITLVKQTPDTAKLSRTLNGLQLSADGQPRIVNPWDEYAIETALQLKEKHGGKKVTALSLGKPEAADALRTSLAMGADEAVLISDPALATVDTLGTARALAAAITRLGGADLIVAGRSAIDGNDAAVPAQLAALLGRPLLSYVAALKAVDAGAKTITVVRALEGGRETVSATLPAILTVVKEIAEPRYPSFMGIRKAAKAPITTLALKDLGLEASALAAGLSWQVGLPQTREVNCEFIAGTPAEQAEALVSKLIEQKVI
ncbi:MAG: electron transfer flavoprotein subunit beta/FixA family protein [Thermoflexales bacterium]|nr:electron transfer flavoprotein subunit beta/FixA family protein [Thermoflexales bacterium]